MIQMKNRLRTKEERKHIKKRLINTINIMNQIKKKLMIIQKLLTMGSKRRVDQIISTLINNINQNKTILMIML